MSIILFIIALWIWFVMVMQDGRKGSMRIVLLLPIILPIIVGLAVIQDAARKTLELIKDATSFIMSIGEED